MTSSLAIAPIIPESSSDRLLERWPAARPFLAISVGCVVVGGFTAAVSRPTGFALGPWAAAYLVLVGGVAQGALSVGQAWLSSGVPTRGVVQGEAIAWSLGVVGTLLGQFVHAPLITTAGGVATAIALIMFLRSVRDSGRGPRWALPAYRGFIVVVLASTPVGLVLAWTGRR